MHSASYGSHDDGTDPPDTRSWNPPDNEVPAAVPLSFVLARTDDVAVAVTGVHAYTSGIAFTVSVRLRHERVLPGRHDLHDVVSGWRGSSDGQLLLGAEFADGRAASTAGLGRAPAADSGLDQPLLVPGGGGGSERHADHEYWLAPVPPPGPLTLVVACTALGIAETAVEVDGDLLVQAAARSEVLWPYEPPAEPSWGDGPDLPGEGWFGRLRDEGS